MEDRRKRALLRIQGRGPEPLGVRTRRGTAGTLGGPTKQERNVREGGCVLDVEGSDGGGQ